MIGGGSMKRCFGVTAIAMFGVAAVLSGCGNGQAEDEKPEKVRTESAESEPPFSPTDPRDVFGMFLADGVLGEASCTVDEDSYIPSAREDYLADNPDESWPEDAPDFSGFRIDCEVTDADDGSVAGGILVPADATVQDLLDALEEERAEKSAHAKKSGGTHVLETYTVATDDWAVSFDAYHDENEKLAKRIAETYDGKFSEIWTYQIVGG